MKDLPLVSIANICFRVTPKWQLEDPEEKGKWFILRKLTLFKCLNFLFRRVVFSVCEDSGHGSSEGEGRVSEVEEEEEEYSYVYSSRVCPAQLIKQQGEEEGEEENIYEEIGQHFAQTDTSPCPDPVENVQQSSPIVRSHLQLYRS